MKCKVTMGCILPLLSCYVWIKYYNIISKIYENRYVHLYQNTVIDRPTLGELYYIIISIIVAVQSGKVLYMIAMV